MKFFGFLFSKPDPTQDKEKASQEAHHLQQSSALENLPNAELNNKSRRLVDSILNVHKMNKPK